MTKIALKPKYDQNTSQNLKNDQNIPQNPKNYQNTPNPKK